MPNSILLQLAGSAEPGERISELLQILAIIVALAVVVSWAPRLLRRPRARTRSAPPDESWFKRPSPGQVWWATMPFSDGSGFKKRPCLVVRTHPRGVDVLKITSQDKSHIRDCIPISNETWYKHVRQSGSWLDLSLTYHLDDHAFHELLATRCDSTAWSRVRQRHSTGWVYFSNS